MSQPCTYILYSESADRYYTGSSKRFENRLGRHNEGKVNSTKHAIPWICKWVKEFETYPEAYRLEQKIKKRGAKRYLQDIGVIED